MLTEKEAAEMLGVPQNTLQARRHRGSPPAYYKFGGIIRYKMEDVLFFEGAKNPYQDVKTPLYYDEDELNTWVESCRVEPGEKSLPATAEKNYGLLSLEEAAEELNLPEDTLRKVTKIVTTDKKRHQK